LRRAAAALAAPSWLLGACIVLGACFAPPPSGSDRQAYQLAVREMARDRAAGVDALRRFVDQRPKSDLADDAALRLADALVEDGRDDEAIRRLQRSLRDHPEGDRADEQRILLARLLRAHGRSESAYRVAREIRLSLLEGARRAEVHQLLAELAERVGHHAGRLRWLARVRADAPDAAAVSAAQAELDAALAGLTARELEVAADELGRFVPAASVRLRQAQLALENGDADAARELAAGAQSLPLAGPDAERLAALEARLRGEPAPGAFPDAAQVQGTLGVVLPLSGELASAGDEVLEGILLASGVFDAPPAPENAGDVGASGADVEAASRRGLRLRVRDTGGAPERAVAAVNELGGDPAVLAVVGPLTQAEAVAVAPAADALALPVVTLTRHEDVAQGHTNVFRIGLTPASETERLAEYAVAELGVRRVGILYPEDGYGQSMRDLFTAALAARGAAVVAQTGYPAETTDFSGPVRSLVRAAEAAPAGPETAPDEEPPLEFSNVQPPPPPPAPLPGDLDAVFVPDTYRVVGLAAPALAAAGLRGVRLLGTSGWNDPRVVLVGREHVDGAVFTGAVVRRTSAPALREFAERFEEGFGRLPDALSAQGFDATLLLLREIVAGHATRDTLRAGLLAAGPFPGVSGETDFEGDGNARRRPHLLGIEEGRIVDLDSLGRAPTLPAPLASPEAAPVATPPAPPAAPPR
jgi:ABC-type branched-subunit amino acid transport system substrate-binding protein